MFIAHYVYCMYIILHINVWCFLFWELIWLIVAGKSGNIDICIKFAFTFDFALLLRLIYLQFTFTFLLFMSNIYFWFGDGS